MESGNKRANHDAAPFAFFIVIYERFSVVNKKNPQKKLVVKERTKCCSSHPGSACYYRPFTCMEGARMKITTQITACRRYSEGS